MSQWISAVIIALIHRVAAEEKNGLRAFRFPTLMSLWISAVIFALIHRGVSEIKIRTNPDKLCIINDVDL